MQSGECLHIDKLADRFCIKTVSGRSIRVRRSKK